MLSTSLLPPHPPKRTDLAGSVLETQVGEVVEPVGKSKDRVEILPFESDLTRQEMSKGVHLDHWSIGHSDPPSEVTNAPQTDTVIGGDNGASSSSKDGVNCIRVKATFQGETVRFKFEPRAGCDRLFKEVAERFQLATGTFRLDYLDQHDLMTLEDEFDLEECLEVLESSESSCVKLLVRINTD